MKKPKPKKKFNWYEDNLPNTMIPKNTLQLMLNCRIKESDIFNKPEPITMKKLIERQSQLLQTMFWTYVELIGIDYLGFKYRHSDNGQALLIKIRNQLASDLKVNPQEVQDHAEECATNIYYFNNQNQ